MRFVRSIVAGAAVVVAGGVLYAGQAAADPSTPTPSPTASTAVGTPAARGAGVAWFYRALTSDQRRCLADAGLQRPKGALSDAQRTELAGQVRAALKECGVELSDKLAGRDRLGFGWASLSVEQQQCLAGTELTRPFGRLTDAQRAALKQSLVDAAAACGVAR